MNAQFCHQCGLQVGNSRNALAMHIERVHVESIVKGPDCDNICKSKSLLLDHQRNVHRSKFTCETCLKEFPNKDQNYRI